MSEVPVEQPTTPHVILDENPTVYKYRDFAQVPEDSEDERSTSPKPGVESAIRVQKFPVKLYTILAQKEFSDIITWMPHGRSWKVLKPNVFESLVMPLFFEYSNYHSFNRLVNAWSFRRVSSGPDRGSYYHELFLRGKPHLHKYMRRLPKTHKKLPMDKRKEPDFYKMAKTSPLPSLENTRKPNQEALALGAAAGMNEPVTLQQSRMNPRLPLQGGTGLDGSMGMNMNMNMNMNGMNPMNPMSMNGMNPMSMNGMNPMSMNGMNSINAMNSMNSMNPMSAMNAMSPMSSMNSMNPVNSMNMNAMNMNVNSMNMNGFDNLNTGVLGKSGVGGLGNMNINALNSIAGNRFGGMNNDALGNMNVNNMAFGGGNASNYGGLLGNSMEGMSANLGGGEMMPNNNDQMGAQAYQAQRLRHLQHIQLFQRQLGSNPGQNDVSLLGQDKGPSSMTML